MYFEKDEASSPVTAMTGRTWWSGRGAVPRFPPRCPPPRTAASPYEACSALERTGNRAHIVYHLDGAAIHAFRFAKRGERPEDWKDEPLVELELRVAVRGADLVLMVPPVFHDVPGEVTGLKAQLLGDVVHDDGRDLLGGVEEGPQEADCAELDRPSEPVSGALGGHRPAPRGLVHQEGPGELPLIGFLGEATERLRCSSLRKLVSTSTSSVIGSRAR